MLENLRATTSREFSAGTHIYIYIHRLCNLLSLWELRAPPRTASGGADGRILFRFLTTPPAVSVNDGETLWIRQERRTQKRLCGCIIQTSQQMSTKLVTRLHIQQFYMLIHFVHGDTSLRTQHSVQRKQTLHLFRVSHPPKLSVFKFFASASWRLSVLVIRHYGFRRD